MQTNNGDVRALPRDKVNLFISGIVFLISFWTYLSTMAPTLSFWDCGEFIACAKILGIPHPPGTPLFILLGRVFILIPIFADLAARINFISVLSSAITVWLAYLIIVRVVKTWVTREEAESWTNRIIAYSGGATGALFLNFSSTFWFNAVEAEVYGITMMIMLLVTYLVLIWLEKRHEPGSDRYLILISYLIFLSLGIHMTTFLIFPIIFLLILMVDREKRLDWRIWAAMVSMLLVANFLVPFAIAVSILFLLSITMLIYLNWKSEVWKLVFMLMAVTIIGYSVQAYIPIRASLDPVINENDPDDWESFKAFLERKQYGSESMLSRMFDRRGTWANQLGAHKNMGFGGFFVEQYSSSGWRFIPFVLGVWGIWESLRRRWKVGLTFFLLFLLCSIGLVLYMNFSDGTKGERLEVRERDYFFTPGFMYFTILMGFGLSGFIYWIFDIFGKRLTERTRMAIAALIGIIAVAFPLTNTSAYHWESHDRTGNYIAWDYAYNILNSCNENGIIFTNGDNDTFPVWYLQIVPEVRTDVRVVNLSLLNTHWYIKQLKHQMGVPIRLTDAKIEQLMPKITADGRAIRVQDIMVEEIIRANNFKEPIYFAVTVSDDNRLGLDDHLRMEGMTYRIVPEKGAGQIAPEILRKRLTEVFQFRGISDPDVYKNENAQRLITNYMSAFLQLSEHYRSQGQTEEAIEVTEAAIEVHPNGWRTYAFLIQIYGEQGDMDKIEEVIARGPEKERERLYLNAAYTLTNAGNTDGAIAIYRKVLERNPKSESAFKLMVSLMYENERYQEALEAIDEYIEKASPDPNLVSTLQRLKLEIEQVMNK
ncbi:MAG: DUF2723 domain-containing protein [candidate division Zixibacteria bacterium]|nr:DUF2723 domain-containing protein [candidate division Zixibacteria bacterium]